MAEDKFVWDGTSTGLQVQEELDPDEEPTIKNTREIIDPDEPSDEEDE